MSNIGEVFGVIEGYQLNSLGKLRVTNDDIFTEINKQDKDIINECHEILRQNGRIYTYEKDKKIKAIYLLTDKQDGENKNLANVKVLYTEEIDSDLKERFDARLMESLKEELLMLGYKKIYVNDKVMQLDPHTNKGGIYGSVFIGALIGFIIGWFAFENVASGCLFAFVFACAFIGFDVVISKKRGRKKK